MCLSIFFGANNEGKGDDNPFGLTPEEQELVNSGAYEPFNFEEEDLEEDDYSYEDDIDENY